MKTLFCEENWRGVDLDSLIGPPSRDPFALVACAVGIIVAILIITA